MQKKVSIIIPVYNGEEYLEKCVISALKQDYDDYEILIVDNNSTDLTSKIARDFEKKYEHKVRYIFNMGKTVADSHNAGILNSDSEYICFLHADDLLVPNILGKLVMAAEQNCSDMVACGMCLVDKDDNVLDSNTYQKWESGEQEIQLYMSSFVLGRLYRREFLISNDIFFPKDNKKVEDMPFITQCCYLAKNIVTIKEIGYKYLYNPKSVSHDEDYHNKACYDNTPIQYIEDFLNKVETCTYKNDSLAFEYQIIRVCWFLSYVYIRFSDFKSVWKVNRELAYILKRKFKKYWRNPYINVFRKSKVKENSFMNRVVLLSYVWCVKLKINLVTATVISGLSKLYRALTGIKVTK